MFDLHDLRLFFLSFFFSGKLSGDNPRFRRPFRRSYAGWELRQEVRSPVTCRDTRRATAAEVTNGRQRGRPCDLLGIPNGRGIRKVGPDQGAGRSLGRVETRVDRVEA